MTAPQSFGEWLRHRRRELDLTQEALAQQVGCARVTIRKLEADEMRPSKQLAELLAEQLDIPSEEHESFVRLGRSGLPAGSTTTAGRIPAASRSATAGTGKPRLRKARY